MALTNITAYKLRKLLKYPLVTQAVALVFIRFSGDPLRPLHLGWLLVGLWAWLVYLR